MNNKRTKLLDCTLRDGGYVNNWDFGLDNIKTIITGLQNARIDYIETGFLVDKKITKNQSLFNKIDEINTILPQNCDKNRFFAMISYGKFDINRLPEYYDNLISGIRFIFKKQNLKDALKTCREIKSKGYRLFINPTFINQYEKEELIELIRQINQIHPAGFTIVDSTGGLNEKVSAEIFSLSDKYLDKDICIGFHSHNNLNLSLENAKVLNSVNTEREIILDCSISGIGRGAGNLSTQEIIQYINSNYNIKPVQELADKIILPIRSRNFWGYSIENYYSAKNFCHPYYARYLAKKNSLPADIVNKILENIPDEKKNIYDKDLIENLYNTNLKIKL